MSVVIVGAGLAGLAAAYRLQQAGVHVQLLEAGTVAGGRIQPAIEHGHQDLGPTWVWPYAQPVVTQWLDELDLTLFEQFDTGSGLVDASPNTQAQQQSLPSQYGIARIQGGTHALINALVEKLAEHIRFEHRVTQCERDHGQWVVSVENKPAQFHADQLIIATPPRLAASIVFKSSDATSNSSGSLLDVSFQSAIDVLKRTETWMAQHAKVVIVYDSAFWREAELSGRIASHVGPLVEVHDHCGPTGTPAALFGFSGVPADARNAAKEQFVDAIKQQLKRCFGETAPEPTNIIIKDWAFAPHTTTDADRRGTGAHPEVLSNVVREAHCERSLWFGASETSTRSPGLIEGALARADAIVSDIVS